MRGSFASHPPTWRKRKRGAAGGPRRNPRARGSSRLSGSPLEPLQRKIDESSSQLKRLEIRKFCANTRELERLNSKECGAVLAADAVNERTKEVFTLPTAAHFHCEKIPSIRLLLGKFKKFRKCQHKKYWRNSDKISSKSEQNHRKLFKKNNEFLQNFAEKCEEV